MRRPAPERLHEERGTTLMEVVVTAAVLALALAAIFPVLTSMQKTMFVADQRSRTNDEAHVALAQVERDVRSGNVLGAPAAVAGQTGMGVTVYTQDGGPPFRCVQYEIRDGELRRRQREAGPDHEWPSTWGVVADGVTNAASMTPAFARSADRQTLVVTLLVDQGGSSSPLPLTTSVTGRNTTYYDTPFSGEHCQ